MVGGPLDGLEFRIDTACLPVFKMRVPRATVVDWGQEPVPVQGAAWREHLYEIVDYDVLDEANCRHGTGV